MTLWEGGGVNNTNVKWTRVMITIYVVDSVCIPNDTGKLQFKWWPLM